MKKIWRKWTALVCALVMALSAFSTAAFAASEEDDIELSTNTLMQNYLNQNVPYPLTDISYAAMDKVFDLCNKLAGATEDWSDADGHEMLNVRYGERPVQTYDWNVPANLDKDKPVGVILFVHGGTWYAGSKENFTWAARRFAKHGYITATLNYDLASFGNPDMVKATGSKENAYVPDMLDDINQCIADLNARIRELGYRPSGLALAGESAGSHLAGMYAYSRAQDSAIPVKCLIGITFPVSWRQGTFNNYSSAECANYINMISGASITGKQYRDHDPAIEPILHELSPVDYINEKTVPTLLGFAGKDTTIGTNQYQTIKPYLDKYHVPYDVVWWPNSNHALYSDPGVLDNQFMPKALQYLSAYLK